MDTQKFWLSKDVVALINRTLDPDEAWFYVMAKFHGVKSVAAMRAFLPGAKQIYQGLQKKGLVPKGRLDLLGLEEYLRMRARNPTTMAPQQSPDEATAKQALEIARALWDQMIVELPKAEERQWFTVNVSMAKRWLKRVPFEEAIACIRWIFEDTWARRFLSPNCTSVAACDRYFIRYKRSQPVEPVREQVNEHQAIWNRRSA